MEQFPIENTKIKLILNKTLTKNINSREIYINGIDYSYYFEGYSNYKTSEL